MKKKKKNKKGFSLVEILAVIVILSILAVISIASIQGIVSRARTKYYQTLEKNMISAAQSYMEKNREYSPKVEGQVSKVDLSTMIEAKYIEKLVDYNKETCDSSKSYVQVFKYKDELLYTPYLECPNYKSDVLANYSNFEMSINFSGTLKTAKADLNVKDSTYGIVSYNYRIYANDKLVYSSDNYSTGKTKTDINKSISLKEYVPGKIKVRLTAINSYGISKTISKTSDDTFKDTESPSCGETTGESTVWTSGKRTITVKCSDGNGVGCTREVYTKEFDTDTKVGTITIKDKEGNSTSCNVNVYIDKGAPTVTLNVYKKDTTNKKLNNTVMNTITADKSNPTKNLTVDKDSVGGWLNKDNYPNGVALEIKYQDPSGISKVEWYWNNENLKSTDANIKTIPETNKDIKDISVDSGTYEVYLYGEGYRYGIIKVTDQVGNTSTINVTVPMDRTSPSKPSTVGHKWTNRDTKPSSESGLAEYNSGWTNTNVFTHPTASTDALSGTSTYGYKTTGASGNNTGNTSRYDVQTAGTSKVSFRSCDKAGNCSDYGQEFTVNLDFDKPTLGYELWKVDNNGNKLSGHNSDEWSTRRILRSLYPSDTTSGIAKSQYSTDGTNWIDEGNVASWTMSNEGINNTLYRTIDNAGNISDAIRIIMKIDWTAPQYLSKINNTDASWGNAKYRFGWNMNENLSGVNPHTTVFEYCYTGYKNNRKCGATCSKGNSYSHRPATMNGNDWNYFQNANKSDALYGTTGAYELSGGAVCDVSGHTVRTYFNVCDIAGNCNPSGLQEYPK